MSERVKELFETTVPTLVSSSPERFRLGVVFAAEVKGVGAWTVNLRSTPPRVEPGVTPRAEVTLQTSADCLEELLQAPDRAMELYYRGDLTVAGDLGVAPQVVAFFREIGSGSAGTLSGLDMLMAPTSASEFLSNHWPNHHLFQHGPVERLSGLSDIPELDSVERLLESWKGVVTVFPQKSGDEHDAPSVPAEQAAELWKRGFALVFNAVHLSVPRLVPHLRRLQAQLGLPSLVNARCIVYATPKGAGAKPHFDQNANFIVQLRGEKVWRLAPNPAITDPSTRYVMGADVPPELQFQATRPFLTEMPADATTYHLRRGSVLFLPNAYWHSTQAAEDGLALNFTFSQPSWADVMGEVVRRRLTLHPQWRELALGAGSSDPDMAKRASQTLERLLAGFQTDLGTLAAASITSGFAGPGRESGIALDLKRDWVKMLTDVE